MAIRLPALNNRRERSLFDKSLNYLVVDERGNEIASIRDRLPGESSGNADLEKAMLDYNRTAQAASVPRFALQAASVPDASLSLDMVWQDASNLPALQRWLQRVDAATRQRFISWANENRYVILPGVFSRRVFFAS